MEQQIRFCTSSDGTRIAYATMGQGPPFVVTPGSWSSMALRTSQADGARFFEQIAARHTLVFYDRRGVGLSDQDRSDFSIEADVRDLAAVIDTLDQDRVILMGSFHLGPATLSYAARHHDRLSRLILYNTYARGRELATDEIKTSLITMARSHWGMASRTFADITAPGVQPEVVEQILRNQRESTTGDIAARLLEQGYGADVTDLLPRIETPTLVLHRRESRVVPFRLGREISSLLPNAQLVSLEGAIFWPWLGDSDSVLNAIFDFLGEAPLARRRPPETREGLATILFTDLTDSTALTQRLGDARAQELVRAHNAIVREALAAHGGREIKHTGDGIMASFGSASGALECAIAIQRGVDAHHRDPRSASDDPLAVHIGLNAGEPVAEDGDLFGSAVQLARRICDQAAPGEILAANVVRELAAGKGFLFDDRGVADLKGFEDAVRLYGVRRRE